MDPRLRRRGLTLDYGLFGNAVVTGRSLDSDAESLGADLAKHARAVTATTLETIRR